MTPPPNTATTAWASGTTALSNGQGQRPSSPAAETERTVGQGPSRRQLLLGGSRLAAGWGLAGWALAGLLDERAGSGPATAAAGSGGGPHLPARARRVIFLHQSGAPSQLDLLDPKPQLRRWHGQELPEEVRMGQRLTTMTADQLEKPLVASEFKFRRAGNCGLELSELLPHTARVADQLCVVRSLYTEAINHDPGITLLQTGSQQPGRPSMGAWISYGLGSDARDLPDFVVMVSGGQPGDQPLMGRLWGAGFLPTRHQGVQLRGGRDPVLFLANPPGISGRRREAMLQAIRRFNDLQSERLQDPEIDERTRQFELAASLQLSVPELSDLSSESRETLELYGPDSQQPGSYASQCLLARRLVERGVRFVQLYHRGWDHHSSLPGRLRDKCRLTDQASAALVLDLQRRGLLDETLVVWAGEFGRTAYCQGRLDARTYGRDHHPRCFSVWLAGGGIKPGVTVGRTDDFSYNVVENPIHVHDLQATLLYCLGVDHRRLTYRFQGRDFRLTDIAGEVRRELLA